jgi:hypothetical protein
VGRLEELKILKDAIWLSTASLAPFLWLVLSPFTSFGSFSWGFLSLTPSAFFV